MAVYVILQGLNLSGNFVETQRLHQTVECVREIGVVIPVYGLPLKVHVFQSHEAAGEEHGAVYEQLALGADVV